MRSAAAAPSVESQRILSLASRLLVWTALLATLPLGALFLSEYGYLDGEIIARCTTAGELIDGHAGVYRATVGIPKDTFRIYYSGLLAIIVVNLVN